MRNDYKQSTRDSATKPLDILAKTNREQIGKQWQNIDKNKEKQCFKSTFAMILNKTLFFSVFFLS